MQVVQLFAPALVLILLLVYIHAIFGIEILKREVIFTDLAIGQLSAIGIALSIVFFGGAYQHLLTLLFALSGALIISYATQKIEQIEAFIGMLYAFGASAVMLLLSHTPDAMELFAKLSASDILFTTMEEVYEVGLLYGAISAVMLLLYPKTSGLFKELLFFGMLALTVTSSVQSAGVLVVFALLVAPAFIALRQRRFTPLYVAWGVGVLLCSVAILFSYHFDFATGYSLVALLSLGALLFGMVSIKRKDN
jgi:zinc/manganese transport system permease protein